MNLLDLYQGARGHPKISPLLQKYHACQVIREPRFCPECLHLQIVKNGDQIEFQTGRQELLF